MCTCKQDILVSLQDLRAAVFDGATERSKQAAGHHVGRSTEVNQFDVEVFIDDDVLVLDVAVNDVLTVEVGYC